MCHHGPMARRSTGSPAVDPVEALNIKTSDDTSATAVESPERTADDDAGLSLEQLAAISGVPARTIRFYQGEKLVPKPDRDPNDARVARYSPAHVERLRLIGELRDRGLRLPAIRNLLHEGDATTNVADWLGLDASLRGSWGNDAPLILQSAELRDMLTDAPPGTQAILEEGRLITRQGTAWLVPSPALVEVALRLVGDGVPIDLVIEAGAILQTHLGRAAKQLIDLFVTALAQGFGGDDDTSSLVEALRPIAGDAARIIFAQQLERSIEALLADTKRIQKR